jgi:hypothetical protein
MPWYKSKTELVDGRLAEFHICQNWAEPFGFAQAGLWGTGRGAPGSEGFCSGPPGLRVGATLSPRYHPNVPPAGALGW